MSFFYVGANLVHRHNYRQRKQVSVSEIAINKGKRPPVRELAVHNDSVLDKKQIERRKPNQKDAKSKNKTPNFTKQII